MLANHFRHAALRRAFVPAASRTFCSEGTIVKLTSVEGHQPPTREESIEGRYAEVLFTSASKNEALYTIYNDMTWLKELAKGDEGFRNFTLNSGLSVQSMKSLNEDLKTAGDLNDISLSFLEVLCENKRLMSLTTIIDKFQKLYQLMNKQEKITIISADELSSSEQGEVLSALEQGQSGKKFSLEFTTDPSIMGGLQMYTDSEFMDLSLKSRIDKIKLEISTLTN